MATQYKVNKCDSCGMIHRDYNILPVIVKGKYKNYCRECCITTPKQDIILPKAK